MELPGAVDHPDVAARLLSLSDALREELGTRIPWVEREAEKTLATLRDRLGRVAFDEAWELGRRLSPDEAVAMALAAAAAP